MARYVDLQLRRLATCLATCLAVVAALALLLDGALGAHHHLATASGYFHAHAHSHGPADASDHKIIDSDVAGDIAVASHDGGSSPVSGPDAAGCCCACHAAVVLPCLNAQALPVVLLQDTALVHRRHGDGIAPDGLRRPPRPLSIA